MKKIVLSTFALFTVGLLFSSPVSISRATEPTETDTPPMEEPVLDDTTHEELLPPIEVTPALEEVSYEFNPPAAFPDIVKLLITPDVKIHDKNAVLQCRGYVKCTDPIGGNCQLTMGWKPIWVPVRDAQGNSYSEMLTIGFGGVPAEQWSYDIQNALAIAIETAPSKSIKLLNRCPNATNGIIQSKELATAITPYSTQQIKVELKTDDSGNKRVKVYVGNPLPNTPIIDADVTNVSCLDDDDHFTILNREGVAGVHHCSALSNITQE